MQESQTNTSVVILACLQQAGRNDGSSENDVRGGINVLKGSE